MTSRTNAPETVADSRLRTLALAAQWRQAGKCEEAASLCVTLLEAAPDDVDALHLLGILQAQLGRPQEAVRLIQLALNRAPHHVAALSNLALVLARLGCREEALAHYGTALALQPGSAEIRNNRGHALLGIGAVLDALADFDQALTLQPDYADAHNNRAIALAQLGRGDEALASFDRALKLRPDYASALCNRANVFKELNRFEEALRGYAEAIVTDPSFAEAYNNRGLTLLELGRVTEAQGDFACAIAIRPDYAEALHNRAVVALLTGDYLIGWRDYEHRWRIPGFGRRGPPVPAPEWRGEDLVGKHILVHEEQGLGDVLQFARFLPVLASRGARVTFAVRASLHRQLRSLAAPLEFVDDAPADASFEFQSALMSLPGALGLTLRTMRAEVPYLSSDPALVAKWRERIGVSGLKIGICWQGTLSTDKGRSAPLRQFHCIAAIPGVRLISLQKINGLDQLANLPEGMRVEMLGEDFENGPDVFADTAAVMAHLDLVITTDTSIAHLAGALGRPVWVALKHSANWRWLLDRSDSPWYPTARLYRQSVRMEWDAVFERMAADLVQFGVRAAAREATGPESAR